MSKKWTLVICLALTVCLLGGCAYWPMAGLTNMLGQDKAVVSDDGATVTISKADYERYKQFDTLLDLMDMSETYFYQHVEKYKLDGKGIFEQVKDFLSVNS